MANYIYGEVGGSGQTVSFKPETISGYVQMTETRPTKWYSGKSDGTWEFDADRYNSALLYKLKQTYNNYLLERVDNQFFTVITTVKGNSTGTTKSGDVFQWTQDLRDDYNQRVSDIEANVSETYISDEDFSNNGEPPYTYDECLGEL